MKWVVAAAALLASGPLVPLDEAGFDRLLASSRGKVLLVNFWATWCEPCRAEMPALAALGKELRGRGLVLATISIDEPELAAEGARLLKSSGLAARAYLKRPGNDEAFINHVDAAWSGALPALFLYDRAGKRVRSFLGETPLNEIAAAVRKLL